MGDLPLSIVIPIYNEVENVEPLLDHLIACVEPIGKPFEVVLVDDGSRDGTEALLDQRAAADSRIRVIHFARNFGQTAAMAAGFAAARGDVIVTLDGDRQNEPAEIPAMLKKLDEGYDLVSGWRRDRQDNFIRRLPSRMANRLIGRVTGVRLNDYGCTLKAYRRGFVEPSELYGEMHRFLPVYVAMRGGRITERVVRHHARPAGTSKYGLGRTFRVCIDLALIQLLYRYASRPSHWFVRVATGFFVLAGGFALGGGGLLIPSGVRLWAAFAGLAAMGFGLGGGTMVAAGLCAELIMRVRYEAAGKRPYLVREAINADSAVRPEASGPPGAMMS